MINDFAYQQESSGHDWLDNILANAISNRASDIHFDAQRDSFNVRLRIDGLLQPIENLQKAFQETMTSKIKVKAKINIAEHRIPQDGHFEFTYQDNIYNIRVSTLPTAFGESLVLRILAREDKLTKLEDLGLEQEQLTLIQKLITSSYGLILATGPTGSGKSTLLYSILHTLNTPERNIVTVENPIELQMTAVRQSQINEDVGFTFPRAIRSIVRQDPDIIMLGEIRDADTAQMTIQAALIGILVFSTFHTFDIPALVTRLLEMGITPSILAQALKGVISTRLIRKICDTCKESYQPNEFEKSILAENNTLPSHFQKGMGCTKCLNSGYLGRTGIFEVVHIDDDIKASIIEKKSTADMYELLKRKKVLTFRDAALQKVYQGVTTLEEVIRVLGILSFKD